MPTITLTRAASSHGTSGWFPVNDEDAVKYQYNANATLGGQGIEITEIRIHGRARNAASAVKQLQVGFKPALNSNRNTWSKYNNSNVIGSVFTAVDDSNGSWKYNTFTLVYNDSTNSTAFTLFAGHMRQQFAAGSPIYLGIIQPRAQFETQIDLVGSYWNIDVDYELLGNVPSANVNTATLGSTAIKTTLNKVISGSSTTIRYKIGSTTLATYNISTGATHTYTVPTSAGSNFPNSKTATLTIEAETFVGGASYGTVSTSVTLNLPSDAAPTATCTLSRTWVSGVASSAQIAAYVQRKSGVSFSLNGSAKYGASIASYRLSIENKTYRRTGNGSIAHSPIAGSGAISYSYTVIDSRGLSRSYSSQISVLAWSSPKVTKFTVERVTSGGDLAVDGTYARVTVQATASTLAVGGAQKNSLSYYVQYRQAGTSAWTNGDTTTVTGGISVNQSFMLKKGGANVGTFDDMTGYEFRLVLSDIYASVNALDEMPTKETFWDVNETNGSMGFGGKATGTGSTPQYDFYGRINARNGIIGGTRYSTGEVDTGNNWVDGKRIYSRMIAITTPATANAATTFSLNMSGMDAAWVDASASFLEYSDSGFINHPGYMASDGGRQFMAQLQRKANALYVVSDGAGTGYVRILYTKN